MLPVFLRSLDIRNVRLNLIPPQWDLTFMVSLNFKEAASLMLLLKNSLTPVELSWYTKQRCCCAFLHCLAICIHTKELQYDFLGVEELAFFPNQPLRYLSLQSR